MSEQRKKRPNSGLRNKAGSSENMHKTGRDKQNSSQIQETKVNFDRFWSELVLAKGEEMYIYIYISPVYLKRWFRINQ